MKTLAAKFAVVLTLVTTLSAYGASGGISVTVKEKGSNSVAFQGATDGSGNFKTTSLKPGAYVVELKAPAKSIDSHQMTVALGGVKGAVKQSAIPSGLALDVQVATASAITGKVTTTQVAVQPAKGAQAVKANVKVMNGKRYVWVPGTLGSNMSGRWVEEGTEGAQLRQTGKGHAEALSRAQDLTGTGSTGSN